MILYSVCEYSRKERYAVLFVGNVGNPFPTNSVNSYIRNSALMGISGILYIFVGKWECGSIKKYFKKSICICKNFFVKKSPHFHNHFSVWKILQKSGKSMKIQSVNVGNLWKSISHKFCNPLQ